MRITKIETLVVDIGQGFRWADMRDMDVTCVHVVLESDEGILGQGTCWCAALPADTVARAIDSVVTPLLLDADPFDAARLLEPAWAAFRVGMPIAAIGVIDVALWDLKGRASGRSIADLLGRRRDRLPACASAPVCDSLEELETLLDKLSGHTYKAVKLHACGNVGVDIEVCNASRERLPDGCDLMMDAMGIYGRHEALALGRELDELGFRWFEDPLSDQDLDGWAMLADRLDTPVAGVDAVRFTTRDYARPIADGAFDIVRMDAARQGITELDSLARTAHAFNIGCEGHAFGPALAQAANLQVGLAAATARFCEVPVPVGGLDLGVAEGLAPDAEGDVNAPPGPGLGLECDPAIIREHALASFGTS